MARQADLGTASLRVWLQKQTKAELVALVTSLAGSHEEVRRSLMDRRAPGSGRGQAIIQSIREEITSWEEEDWGEYYGMPARTTERLHAALEALVKAGQAAVAVELGPELVAAVTRALEEEEEGESGPRLASCLAVLFRALDSLSLSPADEVEWSLDMSLADDYGLCDDPVEQVWKKRRSKEEWSAVADRLAERLETTEGDEGRDYVADWLIRALEEAGRGDEIIPLCEREAPVTFNYERLVERLMAEDRWEEARRWCSQGIEALPFDHPDIEEELLRQLLRINERSGNPPDGLSLQAEAFFADPSVPGFQALSKAAREARLGEAVEAWARHYLETGRRPGAGRRRRGDPAAAWPLPPPGVQLHPYVSPADAPMTLVLLQLAIAENKPDEVLKWYDHPGLPEAGFGLYRLDEQVAEAVKSAHPDRAIAIWKESAEEAIAWVNVRGYEAAEPYLRQMKSAFTQAGRGQEWEEYLASLRERNRRRPRCLEVLDRLEG